MDEKPAKGLPAKRSYSINGNHSINYILDRLEIEAIHKGGAQFWQSSAEWLSPQAEIQSNVTQ